MKKVFCVWFLLMSVLLLATSALAQEGTSEVTSEGCKFTKVQSKMGEAWKVGTQNGKKTVWAINALQGYYLNNGDNDGINITSSPAVTACIASGGFLPTISEFIKLKECFEADSNNSYSLSPKGRLDFFTKFPDMKNHWFWTSSVYASYETYAWTFDGYAVSIDRYYNTHGGSVTCVMR